VVDGGFGVYANNRPRKIAEDVSTMFQDEAKLKQMSSIAKAISRPGATKLIAKDIAEIALRKTDELPVLKRIELANKKKY
jgi:UDP-N-acetylglucosamine:LPS N-acetylglucosamine transferase